MNGLDKIDKINWEMFKKSALTEYYYKIMPPDIMQEALDMKLGEIEKYDKEALSATIIILSWHVKLLSDQVNALAAEKLKSITKDKVVKLSEQIKELEAINRDLEKQLKDKYPGGRKPKYTKEFKEEVRRFYAAGGQTHKSVAAHFNIGTTTVNRILNNKD